MGWLSFVAYLAIVSFSGYLLLYLLIRPSRAANPLMFLSISSATGLAVHAVACFIFNQWFAIPLTSKTVLLIAIILLLSFALILWLMRRFLASLEHLGGCFRAARTAVVLFRGRPLECRFFFWTFWAISVLYCAAVILGPIQSPDAFLYHLPFAHTIFSTGFLPKTVSLGATEFENAFPPAAPIIIASSWLTLGRESQTLAVVLEILSGILCALAVGAIVRLIWKRSGAGWAAATLFLTLPSVQMLFARENIDFFPAAFAGCALWYYAAGVERPRLMHPVAVGLFAALAAWGKYHYLVLPVLFVLASAVLEVTGPRLARTNSRRPQRWWSVAVIVAAFSLITAPFLARNYFFFGNPVYPLFPRLFHGLNADDWWMGHSWTVFQFVGYPWTHIDWGFLVYALGCLPFILLIPALIRVKRCGWRPSYAALLTFGALFFIVWVRYFNVGGGGDLARFLLPTLMVVSAFSAPVFADLVLAPFPRATEAAAAVISLSAVLIAWVVTFKFLWVPFGAYFFHFGDWDPYYTFGALGRFCFAGLILPLLVIAFISAAAEERHKRTLPLDAPRMGSAATVIRYLSSSLILVAVFAPVARQASLDVYFAVDRTSAGDLAIGEPLSWMKANLPPEAVIFTGEAMTYLIDRTCIPVDGAAARPVWDAAASSWDGALSELKRLGVTHVWLSRNQSTRRPVAQYKFGEQAKLDREHFVLLHRSEDVLGDEVSVYRVAYSP